MQFEVYCKYWPASVRAGLVSEIAAVLAELGVVSSIEIEELTLPTRMLVTLPDIKQPIAIDHNLLEQRLGMTPETTWCGSIEIGIWVASERSNDAALRATVLAKLADQGVTAKSVEVTRTDDPAFVLVSVVNPSQPVDRRGFDDAVRIRPV